MAEQHATVLLEEAVEALIANPSGYFVDGTFGRGGHSRLILQRLTPKAALLAFDRDLQAIEEAKKISDDRFSIVHRPFSDLSEVLGEKDLKGKVSGLLLDLGVSSPQFDQADRGFSFRLDGPLDMRMDTTRGESAAQWLEYASEQEITEVIKRFGEEKFGKRIAHAIVNRRQHEPVRTTADLAAIVEEAIPVKEEGKHPATKTFQGIRIFINDELAQLETVLEQALEALEVGGRLVVISFHSLEDRIVKRFIRKHEKGDELPAHLPITADKLNKRLKKIGKAIKPSKQEIQKNPRARSAVMRVAEKLA